MNNRKIGFGGKVLVIINDFGVGGAQRLVIDQIHEMIRRGIKVKVLTLKSELKQTLKDELNISKEDWVFIDFGSLYNVFSWVKVLLFIRQYNPNKFFCDLWMANTVGRICCAILGIKDVVIFELNVYDQVKSSKIFLFDKLIQNLGRKIIACTPQVKDSLLRHGIEEKNIEIIYNSFDTTRYNVPKSLDLKKGLGVDENSFVFLFIGRWVHQKAVDVLIKAFGNLVSRLVDAKIDLVLLGRGDEEPKLRQITKDLNLESKVHFVGIRTDIPNVMSVCDCFVMSSRHEGFPIVLLEAMASKLPVVITDFAGGRDIVRNEVEGLVVPLEDSDALSLAMERVLKDETLSEKMVKNAEERVQEYDIVQYVNKMLSV